MCLNLGLVRGNDYTCRYLPYISRIIAISTHTHNHLNNITGPFLL